MPLLNGVKVNPDWIDPKTTRFIGMWRPPEPPKLRDLPDSRCVCDMAFYTSTNEYVRQIHQHWQGGCFDEPQYATMEEPERVDDPEVKKAIERFTARWDAAIAGAEASEMVAELARMKRDYADFEELSPPDVPRQKFVGWCFDAWEEKCEWEQREAAEGTPDPVAEEMERSRLAWGRARAKDLGVAPDDRQIRTLGIVPWEAAFRAGMQYEKKLRGEEHVSQPIPPTKPIPPRDQWFWKCVTCGNHCLQPHDAPRPTTCHERCPNPDWKLLKHQESYVAGEPDWTHPDGEI